MPSLAGCFFALLAPSSAFAATVAQKDLMPQQAVALEASQERLAAFDRALQALDESRARHKISPTEYRYEEHDLIAFIANEADYQNAILHKEETDPFMLSSGQSEKLQQGCEYALAILAKVAVGCMQGLNGVSP